MNSNWSYSPETPHLGPNQLFSEPCDLEIWQMALKNNMAPLLCYLKLCASFRSHRSIQTAVTVQERQIPVKIKFFLSLATLKIGRWPWQTIGHLFYAISSFVYHFIAIGQFKLELQSGNPKFWAKAAIFCPVWPWNLTDDLEKQKDTSSNVRLIFKKLYVLLSLYQPVLALCYW